MDLEDHHHHARPRLPRRLLGRPLPGRRTVHAGRALPARASCSSASTTTTARWASSSTTRSTTCRSARSTSSSASRCRETAAERPVLFGGPVETSRGLVLHSADYKRDETLLIDGGMALTASLEILKDMAGGSGPQEGLAGARPFRLGAGPARPRDAGQCLAGGRRRRRAGVRRRLRRQVAARPRPPGRQGGPAAGSIWRRSRTRPVAPEAACTRVRQMCDLRPPIALTFPSRTGL